VKNLLLCLVAGLTQITNSTAVDMLLWYSQPARHAMTEALPIGNGRMGALVFGSPAEEHLVVNEDSLWTGDENPTGDYDKMGAYECLGNVFVEIAGQKEFTQYRRELDLASAIARVSYQSGGVQFRRQFFCSHPAGVLVVRFSADRPGQYSGALRIADAHQAGAKINGNRITVAGTLGNGLKYEWQALLLPEGGTLSSNGANLLFTNCNALVILIAAGTDYSMNAGENFRGPDPHLRVSSQLDTARAKGFDSLENEHEQDYQSLFRRLTLDVGRSSSQQLSLPTDQRRIAAFKSLDPELEELLFQYGRYLLISSSRPGGLPANLQGLWNDSNTPAWHSDYHANINIQMNYWPAEVANLSECHLPLFDLIHSQLPAWRRAAARSSELKTVAGSMTTRGFAIRTSHNIMGGLGWKWDKTANAWYCQHFWEHFAFTQDRAFLKEVAYPIMKETCQYWEDHLKKLPDGRLVVPNGWSPEHGPDEDGVSYNQEIVWDLFNHYVLACDILETDKTYRDKIATMRDELVTPGVGSWGQLLEWMREKKGTNAVAGSPELDTPEDHHRHTSHLFGVYPGSQFSTFRNPTLAAAAKTSLDARGIEPGSDVREWSFAWRAALYARLHDGEAAHRMLQQLFSERNTCPNLFGTHPPMQIDGNFGITAGVCEMLLQSQDDELELLPAISTEWPSGSVTGLCARGGFQVDITWRDNRLYAVSVHSLRGKVCRVRYGTKVKTITIAAGATAHLDADLN
jgi:alpha-L-fucosidase 2